MVDEELPVVYGDGIFSVLPIILQRYTNPSVDDNRINTRLVSVRQNIEHIFVLYSNVFELFNNPKRLKLLHCGKENVQLIFNLLLLLNCYKCFDGSPNSFEMNPPSITEYLPLDDMLPPAPDVTADLLGEVYNYYH